MIVTAYEPWMAPHVAELFHREYGVGRDRFADRFRHFYEHPYQRERCLRVAAVENDKVVGFAGFVRWPYFLGGRRFNSVQACDAIVREDHRHRGIFLRLLEYVDEHRDGIDFLVSFPVRMSKGGFLRNGWRNILDLQWSVKLINPFAFLSRRKFVGRETEVAPMPASRLRLSNERDFVEWRRNYMPPDRYAFHRAFELKAIRRYRLLRELIVGDVQGDADFADLADAARKSGCVTYLSFAANPRDGVPAGFRKLNRTIPFCLKSYLRDDVLDDPAKWMLFRSDIDTW